jgi:multiple sugar transport system substrate-binding protein
MEEIELSVMHRAADPAQTANVLQPLLDQFESQARVQVHLQCLDWTTANHDLTKVALYHHGPDVSEIGSTWVSELIAMNAIRPFAPYELAKIGKPLEFVPASWSTTQVAGDDQVWALPWLVEPFVIHYRKDWLRQAGVDEATAFQTHAQIAQTAARLQDSGVAIPVEHPFRADRFIALHVLASWLWGYGGDYLSPDRKRVLFDQPEALAALQSYFGLLSLLSPEGRRLMIEEGNEPLFSKGKSAIAFGTIRLARPAYALPAEVADNWGVAALPQPCFVGGSNLVVWNHTRHAKAAVDLVRFLTQASSLAHCYGPLAVLPSRLAALDTPEITHDPMLNVMGNAIRTGRAYPLFALWGLLEDKLIEALLKIGNQLLTQPDADAEAVIRQQIEPLAQRLNLTLSS